MKGNYEHVISTPLSEEELAAVEEAIIPYRIENSKWAEAAAKAGYSWRNYVKDTVRLRINGAYYLVTGENLDHCQRLSPPPERAA